MRDTFKPAEPSLTNCMKPLCAIVFVTLLSAAQDPFGYDRTQPLDLKTTGTEKRGNIEVKTSVVGYGRAEKSQVQQMVRMLLRLAEIPAEDAADALAVALCHSHHTLTMARLSRASSIEKPHSNITA